MRSVRLILIVIFFAVLFPFFKNEDDGYRVWLRYERVKDPKQLQEYSEHIQLIVSESGSSTMEAALVELKEGLSSMLNKNIAIQSGGQQKGAVLVGTPANNKAIASLGL